MAVIAPKWSPLQEVVCLFTYPKKLSKIISLQKGGKSNMILHTDFLYKYWGSNPIFLYKTAIFSALYGTQAPSKCRGNPNGDIYIHAHRLDLGNPWKISAWFFHGPWPWKVTHRFPHADPDREAVETAPTQPALLEPWRSWRGRQDVLSTKAGTIWWHHRFWNWFTIKKKNWGS